MFILPDNKKRYVHILFKIKGLYGTDLSSTKLASQLRRNIQTSIDHGYNVEIDFDGVRMVTNGWARNAIGMIIFEKGDSYFTKHIKLNNMNPFVRKSILESVIELEDFMNKEKL